MMLRVNCVYNDGSFCMCDKVKRTLFGFGWRNCDVWLGRNSECEHRVRRRKPELLRIRR